MYKKYFDKINTTHSSFGRFGIIHDLIKTNDIETSKMLNIMLNMSDFEQRNIIISRIKEEKKTSEKRIRRGELLLIQPHSYDESNEKLTEAKTAFDWFLDSGTINCYYTIDPNRSEKEYFAEFLLSQFYSEYMQIIKSEHSRRQDKIAPLFSKDNEYDRYELVALTSERCLLETSCSPRVYDKKQDKTFMLQSTNQYLADKLMSLHKDGKIGCLSFRLENEGVHEGKYTAVPLMEAVEQGKKYNSLELGEDSFVTKLYRDDCYNDSIFIASTPSELTFEELYDEMKFEDDTVVTSVVHLLFTEVNATTIISHIDHEFVFYTPDEYEQKMKNSRQKGQGFKRIKIFKADNCSIPINMPCEVSWKECHQIGEELIDFSREIPFLQFVLENCLEHVDLVYEYFEGVSKQ